MRQRFLIVIAIALLAACGGGGGGGGVTPPGPTPTPAPTATPPSSQSQTITVSPSGPVTATFSGIASGAAGTVTMPATVSGTASATLTLQSGTPSGVPTPNVRRIHARRQILGAAVTPIAYVTLSLSSSVNVNQSPSFTFTFPAGALSGYGYVAVYDPSNPSGGWNEVLGPVNASGTSITFTPTAISPAITLSAGVNYVFAIVETGTPLPTPKPSSAPTPADCPANFTPAANGVKLQITDDAGLTNAQLIVYVQNGGSWLSNDGTFDAASPNPLPAACFSTTTGSSGTQPLNIPANVGGRIYFAYAPTPSPGSTAIPNPYATMGPGGPNPGYAAYNANPYPWDFIEYGTAGGATIDTTQVDALGLPLELSVGATPLPVTTPGSMPVGAPAPCPANPPSSQIVGVTSCNFANIFLAMQQPQNTQYKSLVVAQPFLGKTYDIQVLAPYEAGFTSFQWGMFGNSVPSPTPNSCPGSPQYGYLSCVLSAYAQPGQGRLFTSVVPGAGPKGSGPDYVTGDLYCVTSDGNQNFLATDVGPTGTCTSTPNPGVSPNPFKIDVANFMYGVPPVNDSGSPAPSPVPCKLNLLFQQPWGLANVNGTKEAIAAPPHIATGHLFANDDAFALWKGLTADLVYGTALSTSSIHPVGLTQSGAISVTPGTVFTTLFQDPMYDQYDYILHEYFDGNKTYGLAYDDLYNLESGVTWQSTDPIDVRINTLPTSAVTLPSSVSPESPPSSCTGATPGPSLQNPIGSF